MRCFFSSRRRHTRWPRDWSSDVCSSDLDGAAGAGTPGGAAGAGTPDGAEGAGESDPVESAETAESEDFVDSAAPGSSPQPDALGSDESDQSPTGDVPNEE